MTHARILIVEDESILALDLEEILENLGYAVLGIATNAASAIELVCQSQPDLILMDVGIPGDMDGLEAANEIWNRFKLPVVFLTASVDEKTLKRIKMSSAYGCVSKPFRLEELSIALQAALTRFQSEQT
ncbi:MAG TPA: response regulator [Crinalium sp.]|jgi:hypothetical protein